MQKNELTIALPSGKSLQAKTDELLAAANISVSRPNPRSCIAGVSGFPDLTRAIYCKPDSIPMLVRNGNVQLGITGEDNVLENGGTRREDERESLVEIVTLSYSRATDKATSGVLFTPEDNPINCIEDIKGQSLPTPVATEYPAETASYLSRWGVSARFIPCSGGAESVVKAGMCSYGVALTETGDTLRENRLKIIGTVFTSNTVLIARASLLSNQETDARVRFLGRLLVGTLEARSRIYLAMNAPVEKVEDIKKILPALQSPTVQPLAILGFVSIASVVPAKDVNELILKLECLGASGFVKDRPSLVM